MEELAWELLGDTRINTADTSQRRLAQAVVTAYLIVTAALTILAPTLMLNLISIAPFFVTQAPLRASGKRREAHRRSYRRERGGARAAFLTGERLGYQYRPDSAAPEFLGGLRGKRRREERFISAPLATSPRPDEQRAERSIA